MMSLCHFGAEGNDEAARVRSGSDTDGRSDKAVRLPITVVGLHVNLFAPTNLKWPLTKIGL